MSFVKCDFRVDKLHNKILLNIKKGLSYLLCHQSHTKGN